MHHAGLVGFFIAITIVSRYCEAFTPLWKEVFLLSNLKNWSTHVLEPTEEEETAHQTLELEWQSLHFLIYDETGEEITLLYSCPGNYRFEDSIEDFFLMLTPGQWSAFSSAGHTEDSLRTHITQWVCNDSSICDQTLQLAAPCDFLPPSPVLGYIFSFPVRRGYNVRTLMQAFCLLHDCDEKTVIKTQFMLERIIRKHAAEQELATCLASGMNEHCLYENRFARKYAANENSQGGEDGIIAELFNRLDISNGEGWSCEFGAWDGQHLSNTFALIQKGFRGVFIEGDTTKYQDLLQTASHYPHMIPIHAYVHFAHDHERSLDSLLRRTPIPFDFDLLSIDIDSYDYHVWDDLQDYSPKVVIIEFNSQIAVDVDFIAVAEENIDEGLEGFLEYELSGTGFKSMIELAARKHYKFVLHIGANLIFVRNELFEKLDINYENELENFDLFAI
mmetsp:Transcript_24679/g.45994  ORF Transcript_24679/g.45994 Transcript_24679/m.45994 type:complete len:447 (-) Transcript_24679:40-1380(-)